MNDSIVVDESTVVNDSLGRKSPEADFIWLQKLAGAIVM